MGTPKAKAIYWRISDSETRKRGDQKGLDTLVVHALNDVLWLFEVSTLREAKLSVKRTAWEVRPQG